MARYPCLLALIVLIGCAGSSGQTAVAVPAVGSLQTILSNVQHCPSWPGGSGMLSDGDLHRAPQPSTYQYFFRGQHFAAGWNVSKRSIALVNGTSYWQGPSGVCSIDLDGDSIAGSMATSFHTMSGAGYTASFEFSGNGDCDWEHSYVRRMKIQAARQSETLEWDASNGNDSRHGVWSPQTWGFTAAGSKTTLEFISLDRKDGRMKAHCGPVVAAVSVAKD